MEGSDAFAGQEIGEEDPFDGTDFGDFEGPEGSSLPDEPERPVPEPDVPADTSGLPTVDKEGNRVEPADESGVAPGTPDAAPAPVERKDPVGPTHMLAGAERPTQDPVPQDEPAPDPTPSAPTQPAESAGQTEAEEAAHLPEQPEGVQDDGSPVEADPPTTGASPSGSTPDSPPAASKSETPGETPSASSTESDPADDDEAALPSEKTDNSGRVTHRRYLLLKVEGQGKYSEVTWHEKGGNIVQRGTAGAKRQKYALARGQDEALKIGYAAVGSPPRAHLVAVALSSFQPKWVEPDPPKPDRTRLKIS